MKSYYICYELTSAIFHIFSKIRYQIDRKNEISLSIDCKI